MGIKTEESASDGDAPAEVEPLDFSVDHTLNDSWAKTTEDDENLYAEYVEAGDGENTITEDDLIPVEVSELGHELYTIEQANIEEKRRRKSVDPKKILDPRPKFIKTLETSHLENQIFDHGKQRVLQILQNRVRNSSSEQITRTVAKRNRPISCSHSEKDDSTKSEQSYPQNKRTKNDKEEEKETQEEETEKRPPWVDPKWRTPQVGWLFDENAFKRRSKDIERAKEKPVYKRYIQEVPINERVKGLHPTTPSKYADHPRRWWDRQLRDWKLSLYQWGGEEPTDSCYTGSECGSISGDDDVMNESMQSITKKQTTLASLDMNEIKIRPDSDVMASLLGRFDINTMGGESTLKVPEVSPNLGPIDFSSQL